jgi:hypothetical protein
VKYGDHVYPGTMLPVSRAKPAACVLVMAWTLLGCSTRGEGAPCSGPADGARCVNESTSLVCSEGRLVTVPCRGASGCAESSESVRCDSTVATEGDRCDEGTFSCSVDGKSRLKCINGRFAVDAACLGDDGCTVVGPVTNCDTSKAEIGADCDNGGSLACSLDGTKMLVCEGRWVEGSTCRKGCRRNGNAQTGLVECEEELGTLLGPCSPEGALACEKGGKTLVSCKLGRYQLKKECEAGCVATGFTVQCE